MSIIDIPMGFLAKWVISPNQRASPRVRGLRAGKSGKSRKIDANSAKSRSRGVDNACRKANLSVHRGTPVDTEIGFSARIVHPPGAGFCGIRVDFARLSTFASPEPPNPRASPLVWRNHPFRQESHGNIYDTHGIPEYSWYS